VDFGWTQNVVTTSQSREVGPYTLCVECEKDGLILWSVWSGSLELDRGYTSSLRKAKDYAEQSCKTLLQEALNSI
jgi:hypothetical protein